MKIKILSFLLIATLFACKKTTLEETPIVEESKKIAPDGFGFATTREVKIRIRLLTNMSEPLKKIPVTLNTPDGKQEILKALTDDKGFIDTKLNVASYIKELLIKTPYVGMINNVTVSISTNNLELTLGGPKGLSGDIVNNFVRIPSPFVVFSKKNGGNSTLATIYEYMSTYSGNGRPDNILPVQGNVSAGLLSFINASLPDGQDLRITRPQYLANAAKDNIEVVQRGEVFITFVSEGAGNLNSVGFYTYPTGFPPATVNDIDRIRYIFPNASDGISGGGLNAGDRVSLGTFNPGTTIAFVLLADAWDSGPAKTVISGGLKFYTDNEYNPESDPNLTKHSVLLNYGAESLYVIGFEDLRRDNAQNDQDFNDLLLYASANPLSAITPTGVVPLDAPKDCDNDGVTDQFDEFPCDPERAYSTSYPSRYGFGTLAFEDNFPFKGDYDFNDLVLKYRYTVVSHANNANVELLAKYTGVAGIANYKNGFGFQIRTFSPSTVASVTGARYSENYINLSSNGTESGQTLPVIIPFDNHRLLIDGTNNGLDTLNLKVTLRPNQSFNLQSQMPFDQFLISNGRRGYEIHLPNALSTRLLDESLFNTGDARGSSTRYLDTNNMPWVLSFNEEFKFPKEGVNITSAYLKFGDWASSRGNTFTDWYNNTVVGYRNTSGIFGL
jgi:LruC domain-containing protein